MVRRWFHSRKRKLDRKITGLVFLGTGSRNSANRPEVTGPVRFGPDLGGFLCTAPRQQRLPSSSGIRIRSDTLPSSSLRSGGGVREGEGKMALLGDDGLGYELARKLESLGVWRTWLGDSGYLSLAPFLSSPSSWDSFMRADDSKPRAQLHLQLRARALLFDKASASLFLRSPPPAAAAAAKGSSSSAVAVSRLNPACLSP